MKETAISFKIQNQLSMIYLRFHFKSKKRINFGLTVQLSKMEQTAEDALKFMPQKMMQLKEEIILRHLTVQEQLPEHIQ